MVQLFQNLGKKEEDIQTFLRQKNGAVALKFVYSPLLVKKITARPRKNLAVDVKLMYDQKHYLTEKL